MAKFARTWENGVDTSVLTFRGREFTLTMEPTDFGATSKEKCFDEQIKEAFEDGEEIVSILERLQLGLFNIGDEFDTFETLGMLTEFEE